MRHFYLYGPSASGKTTVGGQLAKRLGLPFHDLDDEIEKNAGASIAAIFDREGEAGFRVLEKEELIRLAEGLDEAVISLGGGALLDKSARKIAGETGRVLCLRAGAETLKERLGNTPSSRPLLNGGPEALSIYLERRSAHYDEFDLQLDTSGMDPSESASAASRLFGAYRINGMGDPYDVRVVRGALSWIPQLLDARGLSGPFGLVADANTTRYADQIAELLRSEGRRAEITVVKPGEDSKNPRTLERLWSGFVESALERSSTVVAVGGGMISDLAGFAAGTYLRGVSWVVVPTSLLSMVDASVGGKTGLDLPGGKNLVGAFHPPRLVVADPQTLSSLPEGELRNGMAETVKAAVIGDPGLFARCCGWNGDLPPAAWIKRALEVKIRVIEQDPFEKGRRAVLNYGHTIGHAVEHVSRYSLSHGEAVAIGMVLEARLAEVLGALSGSIRGRIEDCIKRIGLPASIPGNLEGRQIYETMLRDKKVRAGRMWFSLPADIGEVEVREVEAAAVRSVLGL